MSRRHAQTMGRMSRRTGLVSRAPGDPPGDPLEIFGAANVLCWLRGDSCPDSGTASVWNDLSGNAVDFVQATAAAQPTITDIDATLNDLKTLTGDGTDDIMAATLDRPDPSVEPTTFISVIKQVTWTSGDSIYGAGNAIMALRQGGASPQLNMANGSAVNTSGGAALGTWVRTMQQFTGSTSDLNKVGAAAAVTGASAGTTNPGATMSLFARSSANFANVAIFEWIALRIVPSALQVGLYDGYITALTAGAVTV